MTTQPKALALADDLEALFGLGLKPTQRGAALLRRQHAEIERLTTLVADIHLLGIKQLKSQRDEIERLTAALCAATNPPFTGKADTWQAACGKARSERDEARAQIERMVAVNAGLLKALRTIQWSNDSEWQADCAKEAISKVAG